MIERDVSKEPRKYQTSRTASRDSWGTIALLRSSVNVGYCSGSESDSWESSDSGVVPGFDTKTILKLRVDIVIVMKLWSRREMIVVGVSIGFNIADQL